MGNALIGLAAAVIGVTGTLIASVLSQRLLARVQSEQFDRQQQLVEAQWRREQQAAELSRRRDGYMQVSASFRRYRTHLMDFLWTINREAVTPEAREAVEEARRDHHAAFTEAQLIASAAVLAELDGMTSALAEVYRRVMSLEEGTPDPDGSFEGLRTDFDRIWERWKRMRDVMRADIGAGNDPGGLQLIGPRQRPSLPPDGPETAQVA
ncbi:hypothetical protein ABT025_19210 [Streptomyces sp. NPDC002809]|uniref:hypothetical protein n=1 Tax=Streptomyces sp. NPDC002809 TaxID=3154433 RepID=UPI00332C10D8